MSAVAMFGSIGLNANGRSRSDWYAFSGRAGDVMSFETISIVLPGNTHKLDTILRVYDSAGNLIASNDDELESQDSLIFDLRLPADGRYSVQVDTFAEDPAQNTSQGNYVLYMTSFAIGLGGGGGSTLVAGPGSDVLLGGQGNNLFKLAPDAGPVTVISGTGADILDRSASAQMAVKVLLSSANASITQVPSGVPALQFPAGITSPTVPKGGTLRFSAAVTNAGRSVTYSLAPAALNTSLGELAPIGATIRPSDGLFSWSAGNAGTYKINIVATASDGATATTTVTITVTAAAPTLAPLASQTVPVGSAVPLSGRVANPVPGNTYAYAWTITRNNQTIATFSGQSVTFNPGVSGTFTATLTVTNLQDGLTSTTSAHDYRHRGRPDREPAPERVHHGGRDGIVHGVLFVPRRPREFDPALDRDQLGRRDRASDQRDRHQLHVHRPGRGRVHGDVHGANREWTGPTPPPHR